MNSKNFCFPVAEQRVAVDDFHSEQLAWSYKNIYLTNEYKSIVREDTNQVINLR